MFGLFEKSAFKRQPVDDEIARITFVSPLIGKDRAENWAVIEANLKRTIKSLLAQTNPRWCLLLIGQDRPECLPKDDARLQFIEFRQTVETRFDNLAKRRFGLDHLNESGHIDGYVMPLDADDVVHPNTVEYLLQDNNGLGYIVESGYMIDIATARVAPLGRPTFLPPKPGLFYKHCGSSCFVRIQTNPVDQDFISAFHAMGHVERLAALKALGRPLAPIPFPAMGYIVNHGENMREKRGKMHVKLRYVDRLHLPEAKAQKIRCQFGLVTNDKGRIL